MYVMLYIETYLYNLLVINLVLYYNVFSGF